MEVPASVRTVGRGGKVEGEMRGEKGKGEKGGGEEKERGRGERGEEEKES